MLILQSVYVIRIHKAVFYPLFLSLPCPVFRPVMLKLWWDIKETIHSAATIQQCAFLFKPMFCNCHYQIFLEKNMTFAVGHNATRSVEEVTLCILRDRNLDRWPKNSLMIWHFLPVTHTHTKKKIELKLVRCKASVLI